MFATAMQRDAPHRRRVRVPLSLLTVAAALALSAAVPISAAKAQAADTSTMVGRKLPPRGHSATAGSDLRTRSWEQMATDQFAPAQGVSALPFRPTMDPAAYAAAKAAADAARETATTLKPAPLSSNGPYIAPGNIKLNKAGPNQTNIGNNDYPPDTEGAIGPTEIIYTVNQTINIYNRAGVLQRSTTFNNFFGTTDGLSDPRIAYDTLWKRWVVSDTRIPPGGDTLSACVWVAFSQTPLATGAWYVGRTCSGGGIFAAGDLWDYDQLGMSQDAILITGNIFGTSSFKGPAVFAIPKALAYNGYGWSYPIYAPGTSVGTIAPPLIQDANADAFFVATDSNHSVIDLFRGTNLSNEGQASYVLQAQIAVSSWSVPPGARQPGTTQVLDSLDGRFQNSSPQYGNHLWNVHAVTLGSFPAPYFYEIDTSANSIVQSGYFYESGTSDDFNPSISANTGEEAFVAWSSTDATSTTGGQHNAAVRFSGRQSGDPLGSISAGTLLATSPVALTGNQQGSVQRWGDYSRVALDPVAATCGANQRAAVFNETILNANDWSTQYAIIGFCS